MVIAFILFKHGVTEEDKKRLYQHARLDQREIDMVEALPLLGAKLTKVISFVGQWRVCAHVLVESW